MANRQKPGNRRSALSQRYPCRLFFRPSTVGGSLGKSGLSSAPGEDQKNLRYQPFAFAGDFKQEDAGEKGEAGFPTAKTYHSKEHFFEGERTTTVGDDRPNRTLGVWLKVTAASLACAPGPFRLRRNILRKSTGLAGRIAPGPAYRLGTPRRSEANSNIKSLRDSNTYKSFDDGSGDSEPFIVKFKFKIGRDRYRRLAIVG